MLEKEDILPISMLDRNNGMADPVRLVEDPRFVTIAAINKLNVTELKKENQLRGLRPHGKNNDLRKMMLNCMEK